MDVPEDVIRNSVLVLIKYEEKTHNIIKLLCDKNGLNWLCTQMSHHIFPNIGELIQVYLASKLRRGLSSKYFVNR